MVRLWMREKTILHKLYLKFKDWKLFKNNTGTAYQGKRRKDIEMRLRGVYPKVNLMVFENPRIVNFGLIKGSSDIIGWKPLHITEDMIGQEIAQFVAIEIKSLGDTLKKEQRNFLNIISKDGGISYLAKENKNGEIEIKEVSNNQQIDIQI